MPTRRCLTCKTSIRGMHGNCKRCEYCSAERQRRQRNVYSSRRARERYATDPRYRNRVKAANKKRRAKPGVREWQNSLARLRHYERMDTEPEYVRKRKAANRKYRYRANRLRMIREIKKKMEKRYE